MKLMRIILLLLLIIFSVQSGRKDLINYDAELRNLIENLQISKSELYVVIDKSDMTLAVQTKDTIIKEYPVVLGGNPADDKLMEGDSCTPEGTFKISSKFPHKKWTKFLLINYPVAESYKKHNAAKMQGLIPKDADIGGEIGIHGVPSGKDFLVDNRINYSQGCVSLKTADINELYDIMFTGMEVIIKR